jgi:WD40 repeat protein
MAYTRRLIFAALAACAIVPASTRVWGQDAVRGRDSTDYELPGHKTFVMSVSWHPDGRSVVVQDENSLRIWDVETRKVVRSWKRVNGEGHAIWSPDGKRIATGDIDGLFRVRDGASGAVICSNRFGDGVLSPSAWSPDGRRVAVVCIDGGVILDTATGKRLVTFKAADDFLGTVSWSPDGRRLATGGSKNVLRIWSSAGKPLEKLVVEPHLPNHSIGLEVPGWSDSIDAVAWHPSGEVVAAAYEDGTVRVWAPEIAEPLVLEAHELIRLPDNYFGSVYFGTRDLAWSPDGKRLATVGGDGTLKVWLPGKGEPEQVLSAFPRRVQGKGRVEGGALSVTWSPDGKWLAAGGWSTSLRFWKSDRATAPPADRPSQLGNPLEQ